MAKRKSYNPFKMWGSYVGSLLTLITAFYLFKLPIYNITMSGAINSISMDYGNVLTYLFDFNREPMVLVMFIATIISSLVLGFLIGWGIHSLVRWLRK